MKEKLTGKEIIKRTIQAVVAMAVILYMIFLPYYVQHHTGYATYGDVLDFSTQKIIAESDNWKLKAREKEDRTPYLVYRGSGSVEDIPISEERCTVLYLLTIRKQPKNGIRRLTKSLCPRVTL